MESFIDGIELDGLIAFLNETIRGDELTLEPAVWLSSVRWAKTLSSPPLSGLAIWSPDFVRSVGGRIPPKTLNQISNDAGITLQEAKQSNLSLWDLISTATAIRKKTEAAASAGKSLPGRSLTAEKRKYVTAKEADVRAKEKYEKLWRIDNKTEWAKELGCHRDTVGKLQTWHRAKKRRGGWKQVATRLDGTVDPSLIEALYTSDASVIGSLSVEDRDNLDRLPDKERMEIMIMVHPANALVGIEM